MNIFAGVGLAVERRDGDDAVALLLDALLAIEPGVADDRDLRFLDPGFEDLLGDVRLEDPHGAAGFVERFGALALVAVLLPLLPSPGLGLVVVLPDAMIELARKAADHGLVAGVGPAEAAGGEAAEMLLRADHDDGLAHPLGLHGGRDGARSAAVDDDVGRTGRGACGYAERQCGKQ